MQSNFKYSNLIHAMHLASQQGKPYVLYGDGDINNVPLLSLVRWLPLIGPTTPNGWMVMEVFEISELNNKNGLPFSQILDTIEYVVKTHPKNTYGIMLEANNNGFVLLQKE